MTDPAVALHAAMAALEGQRALLGDAVVNLALAPLRERLAALQSQAVQPAQAPQPAQSLRQVSVLFLDVVGSTTLSQHLDPEDVHEVMDGAMQRFTAIVGNHQGKVLQYAGDSLLAVFGAEQAREDDAERAVRAGLALLAEGRAQGLAVLQRHGRGGFDVRVGAHTGTVLLGGGVDEEGSIRGFTVNLAARMEQTAPPGTLRISHHTWRLVRGQFDVLAQPAMQVKGHDEPIQTYLVQGARSGSTAARGLDGVATPMVGRDAELAQLLALCRLAASRRRLQAASVIGDAGLGKSRLRQELLQALASGGPSPVLLSARVGPLGRGQPCGLLRDLWARWLQVADGDDADTARHKLVQGLTPLFSEHAEMHAHLLGQLIGMDFSVSPHLQRVEPRELRERGFRAAMLALQGLAAAPGSLLLLLDDLHWADDDSLDFVRHLLANGSHLPLALVMLARPSLLEHRADWDGGQGQRLHLQPLGTEARDALATALLQRLPELPDELRALVAGRAEGNPYYMEELVQMLMDDGVITRSGPDGSRWQLHAAGLGRARVPTTLTGVLQARLDALAAGERQALQQASIVGPQFWDTALAAVDPLAPPALAPLQAKALVALHGPSAFAGAAEYQFQHHLLHQVTYDTVLKPLRRQGHARVAAWLAARAGDRAGELAAATADHYRRAGDTAQAAQHFVAAAEYAAARFSNRLALDYAEQAAALLPDDDIAACWRLAVVQETVHNMQGRRDAQRSALAALDVLAQRSQDPAHATQATLRRGLMEYAVGGHAQALALAEQAAALAAASGDLRSAAMAHMVWSATAWNLNHFGPARQRAQEGITLARRCGDGNAESRLFNTLGLIKFRLGEYGAAQAHFTQALEIAREHRLKASELMPLSNIGSCRLQISDLAGARRWLEEARATAATLGMRPNEMLALANLAQVSHALHDFEVARAQALEAIAGLEAVQARTFLAAALCNLGNIEISLGDATAAKATFERAVGLYRALGQPVQALEAIAGMAQAALQLHHTADAVRILQPVLAHLDAGGGLEGTMDCALIRWTAHLALQAAEDPRAAAYLAAAHDEVMAHARGLADDAARHHYFGGNNYRSEIRAAWAAAEQRRSG